MALRLRQLRVGTIWLSEVQAVSMDVENESRKNKERVGKKSVNCQTDKSKSDGRGWFGQVCGGG